ncbi:BREX-2 system adenine-specific DNA-methyltransferase PglX [Sorangium sp. So ce1014]|uniref:BREX-2 system adenine-specific DNA-methyltransferase PglX n=1 Tax=Sorangium sp. So ce1014 TaxID=3133326 RepID=UPI003F60AF50
MAGKRKKGADESLTTALARLLEKTLLPDLTARAKTPAVAAVLAEQHAREKAESRTADPLAEWTPRWLEQIGAAWVLSCVFLRTLEDRGLVRHRRIAGEGAVDAEQLFFEIAPSLTARDYLLTAFREVARHAGAEDLLGPGRNPAFRLSPSNEGARALLDFFRQPGEGGKGLRWGFAGSDTRFLGDLYQDLSASVRERYALLQTPVFVEEFILDLTLEPAIATFGLEETHVIDPTCGSGHFLLGAFERICEHRMRTAPGLDPKEHALAALGQVHGVDLNPYAAAIARFRLTLAYLTKAGLGSLAQVPKRLPIEVVVADSLLHGAKETTLRLSDLTEEKAAWGDSLYELEDPEAARKLFSRKYQAVVGNPPYIVPRDKARRDKYREFYTSCHREYALAAPFTERFFQLARDGGFVGLINANSFMKREFGKKLIEEVLPHVDLTRVVDTSGAYIPGHGTPTVLMFGRNQRPSGTTIRAVLGKRGEPETPDDPSAGKVWSSIVAAYDKPSHDDDFISVVDMDRKRFSKHPWSLGGGGAAELKTQLEGRAKSTLGSIVDEIGFGAVTREDDLYLLGTGVLRRLRIAHEQTRPLVAGEDVRDWTISGETMALWPYDQATMQPLVPSSNHPIMQALWPYKPQLSRRVAYGQTQLERGLVWSEYSMFFSRRFRIPLSITFAFVATHNHFVLDRGGKVFNRTAPIIKLPEGATEEDHLALLGYLNSSTACFWMKQVLSNKGSGGSDTGNRQPDPAKSRYEFAGTALLGLPVASFVNRRTVANLASTIEQFARSRMQLAETVVAGLSSDRDVHDFRSRIRDAADEDAQMLSREIYLQEQLDWTVYAAMGLAPHEISDRFDSCATAECSVPLGARPFELALARIDHSVGIDGQPLLPRLPATSPSELAMLWEDLVALIQASPELRFIETPEYKRRWVITPKDMAGRAVAFEDGVRDRVHVWLADCIEVALRGSGAPLPLRRLVERVRSDVAFGIAAEYWSGAVDVDAVIANLAAADAIPYLAALRYTPEGLENRAAWEHTWALQRREDVGEKLADPIPVPPKYDPKDFRDPSYFRLRGKLDVPHERFISYPGAEKDDDPSPLFGWAGWNHLERATALAGLYQERKTEDGWGADRLTPLLAGLLELVPWLKQWHNEMNEEFGERLGDYYERYVDTEARALGLSLDALRAWRPEARGRKGKAKRAAP